MAEVNSISALRSKPQDGAWSVQFSLWVMSFPNSVSCAIPFNFLLHLILLHFAQAFFFFSVHFRLNSVVRFAVCVPVAILSSNFQLRFRKLAITSVQNTLNATEMNFKEL